MKLMVNPGRRAFAAGALAFAANLPFVACAATTEISFYYPIQVGGALTQAIEGYVAEFEKQNAGIKVKPVYSGSYVDSYAKAMTATKGGEPPTVAVLLATDIFSLISQDAVVPIDTWIKTDADRAWLNGFYPAYANSAKVDGKTWSIPFQRSTVVQYYNRDAFRAAGLPDRAPASWTELVEFGKKLTIKNASGAVTQWGIGIPGNVGSGHWLFQSLVSQSGAVLMNDAGTQVNLNQPAAVDALQFWTDLNKVHGIHPPGIYEWSTAPRDFIEGRVAMLWTTTGNLTVIKNGAKFDVGVAALPSNKKPGSTLGGGNFYIFKKTTPAQQEAAFKFVRFMSSPQVMADWTIKTGYVASRADAWAAPVLKTYSDGFPLALVARDQIKDAVPEFSTYENSRTTRVLDDAIQAALLSRKTPAKTLEDAQREVERILKPYQR